MNIINLPMFLLKGKDEEKAEAFNGFWFLFVSLLFASAFNHNDRSWAAQSLELEGPQLG